jgi:putative tryptophan/tyrosine transport system substrate-binding protein
MQFCLFHDLAGAFELAKTQRADAIIVGNDGLIQANRRSMVALAATHKVPVVYAFRDIVDDGALMSYSVNYAHLYYRAAGFVDKIFKGAQPADLPVEQPTKFELVINLKTANALGLTVPTMLNHFLTGQSLPSRRPTARGMTPSRRRTSGLSAG